MNTRIISSLIVLSLMAASCSKDIEAPVLPAPEGTPIQQAVSLDASQLFGVWGATAGSSAYEQSYRVEFQSVDDAEAVVSHWFTNADTEIADSVYQAEYTYSFDGSTVKLTPKAAWKAAGASPITAVHIGSNRMVLYTTNAQFTDSICTLSRIGDPEPTIKGVDRTMPFAGETVTITGRNLQFVDHIYLPTASGEKEITGFVSGSKQISFTLPADSFISGSIRCQSSSAHVSCYSPAYMFCRECVFFHSFNNFGAKSPYKGTEFEYTISSMGTLRDNVSPLSSTSLPEGHCLLSALDIAHPDSLLCFFGDTLTAWPVSTTTDPSKGYLRFSSADRFQHVINNSGGVVTSRSRSNELAIQMDIYVKTDSLPEWNTGYLSYRLNKDQNSLTSSMVANVAMWNVDSPANFSDGWKTLTIPLSSFQMIAGDPAQSLGSLIGQLKSSNLQTIIKLVNYPLDDLHPAQEVGSFQFCRANMRLVPYATPANKKE